MLSQSLFTIDVHCNACKGCCWDKTSNSKTQENARKKFGIIPNNCVNGSDGIIHCPFNK